MFPTFFILLAFAIALWQLSFSHWSKSTLWSATITPLASIIGSGFLIVGPVLGAHFGMWSPLVMALLCAVAYGFGHVLRYSIAHSAAPAADQSEHILEHVSSWALGIAYIISVAYYLNLFGEFALSLFDTVPQNSSKWVTTGVFVVILFLGWGKGFSALERAERITVSVKLAIIAALLVALSIFAGSLISTEGPILSKSEPPSLDSLFLIFGLLVTVQGFETSRYLGASYDAETRIRSMRWAQWVSACIYIIYVTLLVMFVPIPREGVNETEIITLMQGVAVILPPLLVIGALSAQFSAAVADTAGGGGLFVELTARRISQRQSYAILVGIGIALTWSSDVFAIIAYASRAFAVYYALQAALAAHLAWRRKEQRWIVYAGFALLGIAIALFGTAIE